MGGKWCQYTSCPCGKSHTPWYKSYARCTWCILHSQARSSRPQWWDRISFKVASQVKSPCKLHAKHHYHQGGDTRIPLTRWSVGHVWQDKHQSGRFFVFIRQYARICLYMKRYDLGQNPNELLVTSLVCKVGLFYSSVSNNQLFNTKNSFLQLFSWKATLNYEVLFKSVFFTNFFTWNCSKKC